MLDPFQAPAVQAVAPILQGGDVTAAANGQTTTTTVYGVTTNYFSMRDETVTEGAIFSDQEVEPACPCGRYRSGPGNNAFRPDDEPDRADDPHQRPDFYDHRRVEIERRFSPGKLG